MSKDLIIGNFEVIHKGHKMLFDKTTNPMVLTFKNIPRKTDSMLFSFEQKINNIKKLTNNKIYILDLKKQNKTAGEFTNYLKKIIKPNKIIVGSDFKFGSDFKDVKYLKKYFNVTVVNKNKKYSTTKIKQKFLKTKVTFAQNDLFIKFNIEGTVVKCKQLGRKLGYHTANIYRDKELMHLPEGVYYGDCCLTINNKTKHYKASGTIRNDINNKQLIEIHIINYLLPEFYGTHISFTPTKYINKIQKAKSLDDLKKIIKNNFIKIKKLTNK